MKLRQGSPGEVFRIFLKLGLTSFGGPTAHLGYYRSELVERRRWLSDDDYADLVALCQFLPGPASSQIGFALGLLRGGWLGGLLAWVAFTLPSALFLVAFAYGADALGGPLGQSAIHGLKLVAVAVVAHAVWGMARTLCPDLRRALIAGAAGLIVFFGGALMQLAAIGLGALAGLIACRGLAAGNLGRLRFPVGRRAALAALALFLAVLFVLPLALTVFQSQPLRLFDVFYRTGALVFGGGHVVLPLLEARVVEQGWISADAFLAGYGAAQAIPGPLFTFAAYLGAAVEPEPNGFLGAGIALAGIFLPGILLLVGVLPFWDSLRQAASARALMAGVNAAVVGFLAAALYDPIWTSAVRGWKDFSIVLAAFMFLKVWRLPPWLVVVFTVAATMGATLI